MTAASPTVPLVSIIVLCYNHARFAIQCLDSVLAQRYPETELIIMDDASTDSSVQVIRGWISSRDVPCVFIAHERNVGVCKTLNEALSHASGKYISMISTDDAWETDKLERQVPQMEAVSEEVGVLYSDAWRMGEDGIRVSGMFIESYRQFSVMPTGAIFPILFNGNFIPAMTTLIRRSCYATVGPYDERLSYEDWDMWLRLARIYKFIFSPFISATYRLVSNSLVRALSDRNNANAQYSDFVIHSKCLEPLKEDLPRYGVLVSRLAYFSENLYRLDHPLRRETLDLVLKHVPVLGKRARRGVYLLWLCSAMHLPYWIFARLDAWMRWLVSFR